MKTNEKIKYFCLRIYARSFYNNQVTTAKNWNSFTTPEIQVFRRVNGMHVILGTLLDLIVVGRGQIAYFGKISQVHWNNLTEWHMTNTLLWFCLLSSSWYAADMVLVSTGSLCWKEQQKITVISVDGNFLNSFVNLWGLI